MPRQRISQADLLVDSNLALFVSFNHCYLSLSLSFVRPNTYPETIRHLLINALAHRKTKNNPVSLWRARLMVAHPITTQKV